MKNKQLRRVIVFLSCLSLILSLALPVSAEETTDTGTFLTAALPSDIVVSSIINGIGVLPGQNTSEYKSVVDRCVEYLIEQGKVINGKIEVWQREQVGDYSLWKYGIDVSMVDVIRSWLFDNEIAFRDFRYPSDASQEFISNIEYASTFPLACWFYDELLSRYVVLAAEGIYYVIDEGMFRVYTDSERTKQINVRFCTSTSNSWSSASQMYVGDAVLTFVGTELSGTSVAGGLSSGYLPNGTIALGPAYPDWMKNSIAVPLPGAIPGTDEDVTIVPIAPGDTLDDTLTIPQEDVWAGSGSYVDNPSVPGTATLSDVISAVLSIPNAIVTSITEALSKFFGINGTADSFGISLTDFFPFCIPFDIYDFLSVLSADPVAPVFHWELPVPQLGRTFEIDVDLSAWDPVAAVFRTFELLAFIVGLGMVTREKFLRS